MTVFMPVDTEVADPVPMATSQALKAAKKELRILLKPMLAAIPKSSLDSQSKATFQSLVNLRQYQEARRISVYLSMPSEEIQTDEIVRHALDAGKVVFVPYLHKSMETGADNLAVSKAPKRIMDMVSLGGLEDYENLARDAWGIPTVTEEGLERRKRILGRNFGGSEKTEDRLDLVLMPGVAFELQEEEVLVSRLGHGKGFYDYFLHRYRSIYEEGNYEQSGAKVALYGLALTEQFLKGNNRPHIPMGPHDSLLDGLIVGDGQIIQSSQTS